ncbi:MAG: CBS domain-containing protein [Halofilum sp. (in: g-proteobacteria)]
MKVARILQNKGHEVAAITPERPVLEVADQLQRRGIGAMLVLTGDEDIAGIISERDIVHALVDHGGNLTNLTAGDLMTTDVTVCSSGDHINDVMRQMTAGRFRHVPVIDDGRLNGIISIGDVVNARMQELEQETEQLQHYIAG